MPVSVVYLSTYPPRRCGIATFTRDLRAAVGGGRVAALRRPEDDLGYPPEVGWRVERDTPGDYGRVAAAVGWAGAEVASIQHEYGIFGGPDGSHVAGFVNRLDIPAVTTMHTVLPDPSAGQRKVLAGLVAR